jgi:hypothetical protein
MAKKRRKVEEKIVFKRPEFDEREYMKKELVNAKVGVITFFYGLPYAVASWQLALAGLAIFGLMAVIIGILSLRYVYPLFGFDVEGFEKKTWLGNGAVLVLTWLSIWILLMNPPFSDLAKPTISNVQISGDGLNWEKVTKDSRAGLDVSNGSNNLAIKAKVTDNVKVSRVDMNVSGVLYDDMGPWGSEEPHYYGDVFTAATPATISVLITVWDKAGHRNTFSFTLDLS